MNARRLVAVALVAAAVVVFLAVVRNDLRVAQARAAYAEYVEVCAANNRAVVTATDARELAGTVGPADKPIAQQAADEAERLSREAASHAERLVAEWGDRWRRLGLRLSERAR